MKVLVNTEFLHLGGSIVTAVDLADAVRRQRGHEIVFFARPGPAERLLEERDLRLVSAPRSGREPTYVRTLHAACRAEQPDIVHAWDRRAIHASFYAANLALGLPVLGSVTEMLVPAFLPRSIPITYVTEEIRLRDRRHASMSMLQDPPVNTDHDDPSTIDGTPFRESLDLDYGTAAMASSCPTLIGIVSRLAHQMKLESIIHTIDAVGIVGAEHPIALVIGGDGEARGEVQARADAVNAALGRRAVSLVGALVDPRAAYAACDIVVGMGTSAMRGMTFGKPVIVVGELGYAEIVTELSADRIAKSGFYGFGSGTDIGAAHLAGLIETMLAQRDKWPGLGSMGRRRIVERFDTRRVAEILADRYEALAARPQLRSPRVVVSNLAGTAMAMSAAVAPDTVRRAIGENAPAHVKEGSS